MQETRTIRRCRVLSLTLVVLVLAACSEADDGVVSTTAAAPATTTTTVVTSSTTSPTTTATTTTTTTTAPAPTTTEPAVISERSVTVPAAAAPVIDGVINPGEWDGATTVAMSNDDTVYWQHTDASLYVAIDGEKLGAVNLVLATADDLWVLHSSAALGSLLHAPGDGAWEQVHGYTWCCRSATDDTARNRLFDDEGWQANIGYTGDVGVVEYQVALPWGFATAALVYHTEDGDSAYWPTDLEAGAVEQITTNMWTDPALDTTAWWMLVPGS